MSLPRPEAVLLGHNAVLSRLCALFTASVETGLSSVLLFEPTSQEGGDGGGEKKKKKKVCPQPAGRPSLCCCSASQQLRGPLPEGKKATGSSLLSPEATGRREGGEVAY